jgi:hypothetical protein
MPVHPGRKRRYARLTLSQPLVDQVTASHDVAILDLSMAGARVEHTMVLRPGGTCHLRLPIRARSVMVVCNVVWSKAVGRAEANQGGGLLYQSGLEFVRLTTETQAILTAFLEEHGTPPPDLVESS